MCSRPSVIFRTVAELVSLLVLVGKRFLPQIPFSKLNSPARHPPCHHAHAICSDSLSQLPTHLHPATSPTSSAVSPFLPVASPQAEPAPASGQLLRPMPGLNLLPWLVAPYCPTLDTKAKVFNSGRHLVTPILPHSPLQPLRPPCCSSTLPGSSHLWSSFSQKHLLTYCMLYVFMMWNASCLL